MTRLAKLVLMLTVLLLCSIGPAFAVDLVVDSVSWAPQSDISAGQQVTFTAGISNLSSGFTASVYVDFQIDGVSVATGIIDTSDELFASEETREASATWIAEGGEHTLTVVADSIQEIPESDEANNTLSANLTIAADTTLPEAITGLAVVGSSKTSLTFSWTPSANSGGDLAGYKVYFNGATEPEGLSGTQSTFQKTGLSCASAYDISVTAYDHSGNESSAVTLTGYTLLENPSGLIASARPAFVDLSWEPAAAEGWVKHYAVFVSDINFLSIEGMSPRSTTTDTTMTIGGLENDRNYYFAVVAVNLSGGMDEAVTTISVATVRGTAVSGNITKNTTWTVENSPYVVTGDVTVYNTSYSNYTDTNPYQATLTLEPGVEVRFEPGTGLIIGKQSGYTTHGYHGALSAQGTAADPIIFTSNVATPAPGDWKGICFQNATYDAGSLLEYCTIEYGGAANDAAIYISQAGFPIRNSTIRHSSTMGIRLTGAGPSIDQCTIIQNASDGINGDSGSGALITNNTIRDNGGIAVNVYPRGVHGVIDNIGSGNGFDHIRISGGDITASRTWKKQATGSLPYVVTGDITVCHTTYSNYTDTNPYQVTLTLEPGVEVRFEPGTGIIIGKQSSYTNYGYYGGLFAQGTAADPIIFTSNAATPAPGDWKGIYFHNATYDAGSLLEYCTIEYGGHTHNADISINGAGPMIKNNIIRHSSTHGIYLNDSVSAQITGNTFSANGVSAVSTHPVRAHLLSENTAIGEGKNIIQVRGGEITANRTWKKQATGSLPYVVTGDITVCHTTYSNYTDTNPYQVTLTLEPGVEVRFEPGTGITIGKQSSYTNYGYYGGLFAQGTAADPIIFTSNAATPAPGDWKGIYFQNATYDAGSLLEYCTIEYGGAANDAAIYISQAGFPIRNSTIRHSSTMGIRLTGAGPSIDQCTIIQNASDGINGDSGSGALITNNTIRDNGGIAVNVYPRGVHGVIDNIGSGNGFDHIRISGGDITASRTWKKQATGSLPYVVTGDITVCHTTYSNYTETNPSQATLILEPGVEVRFEPGTGIIIGKQSSYTTLGYHGALFAQGTAADPIIFTSNAPTPAPGNWKGIYFHNATYDAGSLLEHCSIEYGGHTHNANIYINNAKPSIQYNTLRNSSHSGIYVTGDGSDGAVISCNNFKDNLYGIYTIANGQPAVSGNNFLHNRTYGLNNAHSQMVTANDNWWGDVAGPNTNGDSTFGSVTADTWLSAESACIFAPPTNSAPFTPKNPNPTDNAVRVLVLAEGRPAPVVLTWAGGDPNPWDTVAYDIYFGQSADALTQVAESITETTYSAADLSGGATYFWQVVARDNAGGRTAGPVWKFTTLGAPPDLSVSNVSLNPSENLIAGQNVTISATVTNIGTGPVVDAFTVRFSIDGVAIGTQKIDPIVNAGQTRQVSAVWTAAKGSHTLNITADSTGAVDETFEENNVLIQALPLVVDTMPPTVQTITPSNGAILQSFAAVTFTLADAHGSVNDAAVIASVRLVNGNSRTIGGSTVESNDRFTFTPAALPLDDGAYTVAFDGVDDSGNSAHFTIAFTLDGQVPAPPVITGSALLSGLAAVRPATNQANTASVTLTGTREENTALYINAAVKVAIGSGNWSCAVALFQGANALEIWSQDAAGNRSASVFMDIEVDSIAPSISATTPAADAFLKTSPNAIVITYTESGSGLNAAKSAYSLKNQEQVNVTGTWDLATAGSIVFTPAAALSDGLYTLAAQLEDHFINRSSALSRHFTVDTQAPAAPVLNAVTSPTHTVNQVINGSKEAYAAISLSQTEVVDHTPSTTWQYTATLTSGENTLGFTARDRAGNTSQSAAAVIVFDDIAPDPVTTLTVNGQGSGTTASLNWTGYNEAAHGDVASYRIYWQESTAFGDVSALSVRTTVPAHTFVYTATGLTKGATVFFAVVAVDKMGNANPAVMSISAVMTDTQAPENAGNLAVQSFEDRLAFSWTGSVDSAGDLIGYRIYADGSGQFTALGADQLSYELSGLTAASVHTLRVTAVDNMSLPNESSGVSISGATWLLNPGGLTAEPFSGYVHLSWNGVQPASQVKQYRIYVSESAFSTISGLSPAVSTSATSAKVAGLTNGTAYWFAVTTVNSANGQRPDVTAVSVTPQEDIQGPQISGLNVGGTIFGDGFVLTKAVTLSVSAADPSGVSRIEFSIDEPLIRTDYAVPYTCYLDPTNLENGLHLLSITAYDSVDNSQTLVIPFTVSLAKPAAPVISQPVGTTTNKTQMVVSGQAERDTSVELYNNDLIAGVYMAVDGQGYFSIPMTLTEGENRIQATASNRSGEGPRSTAVVVTLDTSLPSAPGAVAAQAQAGGVIRVSWQKPAGVAVVGYNLYRHTAAFAEALQAQKININALSADRLDDVPPEDGTWYYRVTSIDAAGNESDPSPQASAVCDSTAPRAESIVYSPKGAYDPQTQIMAPGTVNLALTVSETLQAAPFLSITPAGGVPISVDLVKNSDLTYSGAFVIAATTPSGNAWAIFSARDMAGNRGTEIDQGAMLTIDAAGPAVTRLVVTPPSPIQNAAADPVSITAVMGLSGAVKTGSVPSVGYLLSGLGRQVTPVDAVTQIQTQAGDAQTWQAVFALPSDAGFIEAESFAIVFKAVDDLDNLSSRIEAQNRFQVYQGDLPPLSAPDGLKADALIGGRVRLIWNPVDEAVGCRVYRKGPDETELTALTRVESGVEYEDTTSDDGYYSYAVASIRSENGQETESGLSAAVSVYADATAPPAPTDFTLELVANGVKAQWSAPAYSETVTYSLYRAPVTEITSVDGLTALARGITQTLVVDPNPSQADHCYAVTAVDAAGNQSPPAPSVYLNFQLLPVSSLTVLQTQTDPPMLTWTHGGNTIAGYQIYLGSVAEGVKLNQDLITGRSYTDVGWAGDDRQYTVAAVDTDNVESLGRTIVLPMIQADLAQNAVIRRGVMNRLTYTVVNKSAADVTGIRLKAELAGRTHYSESFNLAAGRQNTVSVVVGGYDDLIDPVQVTTTIEITPNPNEQVQIVRQDQTAVGHGMLVLQIANDTFTRGGQGKVWFTLENSGAEEIEIVSARNSGKADSDQVVFTLLDADENVIAVAPLRQAVGEKIVTLSDKTSVARLAAGEIFTAAPIEIPVSAAAPDDLTIRLAISDIYYHLGKETQVRMAGLSTTHPVTLAETAYFGQVDTITPQTSNGDQQITITGRAIERSASEPMGNVPLNLVVSHNGFERNFELYTGSDGVFTHIYMPVAGDAGQFSVRTMHPDLTDKPVHGWFVISRVSVSPTAITMNIPRNYEQKVSLTVTAGAGTDVSALRLVYDAIDQPAGILPEGIHLDTGAAVSSLTGGGSVKLPFTVWADNSAAETESLILRIASAENENWAILTLKAGFSDAEPVLFFTPDHIETGVAADDTVTETVTLKNKGLAVLTGVTLSLLSADGSAAPAWSVLNGSVAAGELAVGQAHEVGITFAPGATVAEGIYHLILRVAGDNYPVTDINLYVAVTQSGLGNALFKVSDIYTGTLDKNLQVIQGLAGAKISLQNELVATETYSVVSDAYGEAAFNDLPTGRYKTRITADNHQEQITRIWVKPGITVTEDTFLDYNTVTVEWSVNEITIEDKYEIVLSATYETNVPAAVVVIEPTSITLPDMRAGDVFNTEITLTNHGLIRADQVVFALPQSDANFKYEALVNIPESLGAKQRVTIPIRVTCLTSLIQDQEGSGGGCRSYLRCGNVSYIFICANGKGASSKTTFCVTYTLPGCSSGGSGGNSGGGSWGICADCGDGGSTSGTAPAATPIEAGPQCYPDVKSEKECWYEPCGQKVTCQDVLEPVGSEVNALLRRYTRTDTDLAVKVPGGVLELTRVYRDYQWTMEPFGVNSTQRTMGNAGYTYCYKYRYNGQDFTAKILTTVIRNGVVYRRPPDSFALKVERNPDGSLVATPEVVYFSNVFVDDDGNKMTTNADGGYTWKNRSGKQIDYDDLGRVVRIGNRSGILALPIYDDTFNGRLIGIADRNGRQVIWYEYDENQQVVAVRDQADPAGRRVQYHYDAEGRLSRVTDVMEQETRYTYATIEKTMDADLAPDTYYRTFGYTPADAAARLDTCGWTYNMVQPQTRVTSALASIQDPLGRVTRMVHNEYGELTAYEHETGRKTFAYNYDKTQKEYYVSIGYPSGKIKEVWYDSDGNTRRVDINGRTVKRIAEDKRNIEMSDEKNRVTRYEYDQWDNLIKTIFPDGTFVENQYDPAAHLITQKTDEKGVTTRYTYTALGLLSQKIEAAGTADERISTYDYDADGNLIRTARPGAQTQMTYDALGNLSSIIDPAGRVTRFTAYDTMGNVLSKIDALGKTWTYAYDAAGRLTSATDALNHTTQLFYDAVGNRIRSIDAQGHATVFEYDGRNNLIRVVDADGNATGVAYNSDNRMISQTDASGSTVTYAYDSLGRLLRATDANGNDTLTEYGQSVASSCAACSVTASDLPSRTIYPTFETSYLYDLRDRKTAQIDHVGDSQHYTRFSYDPAGNLTARTDKEGRITHYYYDALNRLIAVNDPTAGRTGYEYDNRDNLIAVTDAENQTTRFAYDAADRLVKEIRPAGNQTVYSYDAAGNLSSKTDAKNQKAVYIYDAAGRLEQIRYFAAAGETAPAKTVGFTYDKVGNLTGYTDGITSGVYSYDDLYRKTGETVNYGGFSLSNAYTYYANGLKKSYTSADGITFGYLFDANNQLTGIQLADAGFVSIGDYHWMRPSAMTLPGGSTKTFDYDPLMRVKQITSTDPAANPVLSYSYSYDKMDNIIAKATEHGDYLYGYDDLYRLIDADNPDFTDEAFTYDGVGNRLSSADTAGEWNYNENNELAGHDDATFTYDANGNMIEKNAGGIVTKFFYNLEDRLARVEDSSGNVIAQYDYDPFGRRLWKEVSGVRTYFHYSDEGLVGEYAANGAAIKTYGWKPGSTWSTDPLFMRDGSGQYYWYHNDHLGTPQKMTTSSGAVVWSATYSSFGKAEIGVETVRNNLRFAGQYFDAETGLHYNYHRYHDPAIGRYLTVDPIGLAGGINPYVYVKNNPGNLIDPDGLMAQKLIKLSKKLYGKIMSPAAGKDHRMKIYDKQGNYQGVKVFKDGRIEPPGAKLPQNVIDKAIDLLPAVLLFMAELLDPFDADALGNPEEDVDSNGIPDYLETSSDPCEE